LDTQPELGELRSESLRRLHRGAIDDPGQVRAVFERLRQEGTVLGNGIDRASSPRTAVIRRVAPRHLELDAKGITYQGQPQIYMGFELAGVSHFFAGVPVGGGGEEPLILEIPAAIYQSERRDLTRSATGAVSRVEVIRSDGASEAAWVADASYQGVGMVLPEAQARRLGESVQIRYLDGPRRGQLVHGLRRHLEPDAGRAGWVRVGFSVSGVESTDRIAVDDRSSILDDGVAKGLWRKVSLAGALARAGTGRIRGGRAAGTQDAPRIQLVEYPNSRGLPLRAIVDSTGDTKGAPVVVIPPAWGKTKETLLALARVIVKTFEDAGEAVVVVRFDGTNRRGESYIAPDFRSPGQEYLGFTFSEAVRDIQSTLDFFEQSPSYCANRFVLVTYSLGAIEGRRSVAVDDRFAGWVSVVGMVDLQSGLRTVSGGVDYAFGLIEGVSFGLHELVGVVADMDHTGRDALEHSLVFAEDARRDMARIEVPVTWIHGRYDAWMDLWRVRDLLSAGDLSRRKLIQVPAGHQMRSSREALETFQLVAEEVTEMALGSRAEASLPDVRDLELRRHAERSRLKQGPPDLRSFWRDYLLGRDRSVGIELMTSTGAYQSLMATQIERLALGPDDLLVDLGAGAGDCPLALGTGAKGTLRVVEIDYVLEALMRGRARCNAQALASRGVSTSYVCSDVDSPATGAVPLRDGIADAILASLLISYVNDATGLLREAFRLLKPGGRLVVSSLREDADISGIYVHGVAELPPDRVRAHFGDSAVAHFDSLQRTFLNDAAKILELEEAGQFRFWSEARLVDLVRKVGFDGVQAQSAFGEPPQAVVVSARRPS